MGTRRAEWFRSWWLLLTLVPMGLFAPVVFATAGIRARRRDWVVWGLVYAFVFWGAITVAGNDELDHLHRTVGAILALGTPVPVVHALLIRRAYLTATAEPDDPIVARRRRARDTAIALWITGLAFTALGVVFVAQGEPAALGALLIGVVSLVVAPSTGATARARPVVGSAEPSAEPGLSFRYSAASLRRGQAVLALFALGAAAMALWASDPVDRVVTGGAAAILVACAFASAGGGRDRSLVLTPTGIRDMRGRGSFVPWDVVESLGGVEISGGNVVIVLTVTDPAAVETSRLQRLMMRLSPGWLGDWTYAPAALGVEPEWLVDVIGYYWLHPEDRRELGTHRAVERFEEIVRANAPALAGTPARP